MSVACVLVSCMPAARPSEIPDPIAQDPISIDLQYPTATRAVRISSTGARMNGLMFIAQGVGPHPTVILLHGLPGHGGLRDLAETIRRGGWNVLTFQYRGAWGSEGSFSLEGVLDDVAAAVAFVRGPEGVAARSASEPLVLIGHSMGGWAALMAAAHDSQISAVASIAGWNVGRTGRSLSDSQMFAAAVKGNEDAVYPLRGTSAETITRDELAHAVDWDLVKRVPGLVTRPVLLIAGTRDNVTPVAEHHGPVLAEFRRLKAANVTTVVLNADHSFSDKRVTVARTLISWLATQRQQAASTLVR
jgi:pimeloyl-ACP methyl ester carboxylesterase